MGVFSATYGFLSTFFVVIWLYLIQAVVRSGQTNPIFMMLRELKIAFPTLTLCAFALFAINPMTRAHSQDQSETRKDPVKAPIPTQGPGPGRSLPEPANLKLPSLFLIGDSTVRNGQGDGSTG